MTPFSCSMTHFMALNRHGKLSVLGRVSPAAAPAAIFQPIGNIFPTLGSNSQVAQEFALKYIHTRTLASSPQIRYAPNVTPGGNSVQRGAHYMEDNIYQMRKTFMKNKDSLSCWHLP